MFRFNRLIWIFGILLLIGTVAGAGWMLNRSHASSDEMTKNPPVTVPFGGRGIAAEGFVDVEPGIGRLYPAQLGKVVWVIDEGKVVKAGEVLLRVDDRLAQAKLSEAKVALAQAKTAVKQAEMAMELAKIEHEEAKIYPDLHASKIKQQEAWLMAVEKEEKTQRDKLEEAREYFKKGTFRLPELTRAEDMFKKIAAGATVEREKLAALKLEDPQLKVQQAEKAVNLRQQQIEQAKKDVEHKQELIKQAEIFVDQHRLMAPRDGMVLRVHTRVGEVLGDSPKAPAIEFCPQLPKIIRTEVLQEWAATVKEGQEAIIEDDTHSGYQWRGKVVRVSDWFTQRRSVIQEPFRFNDVRTLECIVTVEETPELPPLRIGQRMRVMIHQGGP